MVTGDPRGFPSGWERLNGPAATPGRRSPAAGIGACRPNPARTRRSSGARRRPRPSAACRRTPAELPTRVRCASARCAGLLVSLLEDCVASIEHLDDAPRAYYTALEHSALLANCIELDQATAPGRAAILGCCRPSSIAATCICVCQRAGEAY